MRACEQRDELQKRLRAAFEEWNGVKDIPYASDRTALRPGQSPKDGRGRERTAPHTLSEWRILSA